MQWVVLRPQVPKSAWLWALGSLLGIGLYWLILYSLFINFDHITLLIISVFIVIGILVFLRSLSQQNGLYLDAWIVINCVGALLVVYFIGTSDSLFLSLVVGGTIFGIFTGGFLVLPLYFSPDRRNIFILYIINSIISASSLYVVLLFVFPLIIYYVVIGIPVLLILVIPIGLGILIGVPGLLIRRLLIWGFKKKIAPPTTFNKLSYESVVVLNCLLLLNVVFWIVFKVVVGVCCDTSRVETVMVPTMVINIIGICIIMSIVEIRDFLLHKSKNHT